MTERCPLYWARWYRLRALWMRQRCPVCGFSREWHLDAVMPGEVWVEGAGVVPCADWAAAPEVAP